MNKYIFVLTSVLFSTLGHGAAWGNYTFPQPNLPKDPVTGKSPYVGLARPATFENDMAAAVRLGAARLLTSDQHGCNWATAGQIYAFKDGAIYTDKGSSSYNIFPREMVLRNGCWLPVKEGADEFIYPVTPSTQLDLTDKGAAAFPAANFKDLRYSVDILDNSSASVEVPITDKAKFQRDMARGVQMSQKAHGCPSFAKKPFIYVFTDAVVYARLDNASFSVYSRRVVEKEKGCNFPPLVTAETFEAPEPINFVALGFNQNPDIKFANTPSAGGGNSYLDKNYAQQKCEGSWSWKTSRPMVYTTVDRKAAPAGIPTVEDWSGDASVLFPTQSPVKPLKLVTQRDTFVHYQGEVGSNYRGVREAMLKKMQSLCNQKALAAPKIFAFNPSYEVEATSTKKPAFQHLLDAEQAKQGKRTQADIVNEMFASLEKRDFTYLGDYAPLYRSISVPKSDESFVGISAKLERNAAEYAYFAAANAAQRANAQFESLEQNRFKGEIVKVEGQLTAIPNPRQTSVGPYWSGIEYECTISIQPRVLKPKLKTIIPVQAPDTLDFGYDITRYTQADALTDSRGIALLGKTRGEIETLKPSQDLNGVCTVDRSNPTAPKVKCNRYGTDKKFQDAADLFERKLKVEELTEVRDPSTFVCSSGDHLPSLVASNGAVDEARTKLAVQTKYEFLYASIVRYMKSVSLVDYLKKGYCQRLDASCTYEKSPELSAMFRNFQALRAEKQKYLAGYKDGTPIVNIESFYFLSENSLYPEHKLQGL